MDGDGLWMVDRVDLVNEGRCGSCSSPTIGGEILDLAVSPLFLSCRSIEFANY